MSSRRILIVDDSSTIRALERMFLAQVADELFEAKNGEEAVEMALRHRPDLILLDYMMPIANGLAALRCLRLHETTRDTPVIMVTTRAEMEFVEESFASGCTDYVTKPIDQRELLAKVEGLLGAAQ